MENSENQFGRKRKKKFKPVANQPKQEKKEPVDKISISEDIFIKPPDSVSETKKDVRQSQSTQIR